MRRTGLYFSILALSVFGISFYGCSNPPATTNTNSGNGSSSSHDSHDGHDHGDDDADKGQAGKTDMEKMADGLAKLSEADRASAMKQHMCPVSGEMLGTMGEPIKVTVKDQEVWICCDGCKEDLLDSPDEYLAKLKN